MKNELRIDGIWTPVCLVRVQTANHYTKGYLCSALNFHLIYFTINRQKNLAPPEWPEIKHYDEALGGIRRKLQWEKWIRYLSSVVFVSRYLKLKKCKLVQPFTHLVFFCDSCDYVSIFPNPPTHLVSKRKIYA